jgi:formyl-CoA transferase
MRDAEIAICAIYTADEAIASEHARERGMIDYTDHPVDGRIPHLVDPLAKAGLSDPRRKPSPGLGEHTQEIVEELKIARKARTQRA